MNGKRFLTPKAEAIKLRKNKDGSTTLTGVDGTENKSALKLTYNVKTGQFRGTFKLYAVNAKLKRLKSYTVRVTGYMIQDLGFGTATLKNPKGGPWQVEILETVG
ncbi:MAG: hypothetical protein J6Z49_05235 [Kiritimatiellae bacterium]|nr:hypothetical protein [Kiritimatiellia bacterium]